MNTFIKNNDSRLKPKFCNTDSPYNGFLVRLFSELDTWKIPYCVLRNFEELPVNVDGDIDILVKREDIKKVEKILMDLMRNFFLLKRVEKNGHLQFYVGSKDEIERAVGENRGARVVQLDFVTQLQWKGMVYMDTEAVLSARILYKNFYVAAPTHRVAHLVSHAILDKNFVKSEYKKVIEQSLSQYGNEALASLYPFIGNRMVKRLFSAFCANDCAEILKLRKPLIVSLMFRSFPSALSCLLFLIKKCIRIIRAVIFPPGVLIATAGPDGAGKSTLLNRVGTVLIESFDPIKEQYMGWKQFILPTKRLLSFLQGVLPCSRDGSSSTEGADQEMNSSWIHNFSVLHYFLDLLARYVVQVRPVLARGGMVLCDRYFYDVLVQNVWLCRNTLARSLLLALTPKPSVSVIFTGNPEEIAARKQENSPAETQRQMTELLSLRDTSAAVLELGATNALDRNVLAVATFLFEHEQSGSDEKGAS